MRNRPGLEDGPRQRCRNFSTMHADNPHLNDVINDSDGTSHFKLDTIAEKHVRTIDLMQGGKVLFSISIGSEGVCYQLLDRGRDEGCYTLWEDEV